jgi:hypothetical protein
MCGGGTDGYKFMWLMDFLVNDGGVNWKLLPFQSTQEKTKCFLIIADLEHKKH